MGLTVDVAAPGSFSGGLIAAFAVDGANPLAVDVPAGPGSVTIVHAEGRRVAVAGIAADADADAVRTVAALVARDVHHGGEVGWMLDERLELPAAEQARAIVEGTVVGGYDPGRWKTTAESRSPVGRLTLLTADGADVIDVSRRAAQIAAWTNRARDLANAPPNDMTPERLAERAKEIAAGADNLTADALGPEEIHALGMGAFAGVAQGSHNPARLIVMHYDPPEPARGDLLLGLVGKAITFDSGGISLKPSLYMEEMKGDMAGGAAVIEAMGALAELGVPLRVLAVVAASENMVGGGAFRPGDILRALNGKTIEVSTPTAKGGSSSRTRSGTRDSRGRLTSSTWPP